jgi:glyoxylase-like metal-dependent hydrolase (beta-lactamase superfamily II)
VRLERSVADGIHRVEDGYVNFYLVEGDDGLTVVDAAHPRSWSGLLLALDELGLPPSHVRALVLTHGHFDHVGFAERLRRELDVPVWVHAADAPLVRHPWSYQHERSRARYLNPAFLRAFSSMGWHGALFVRGVREVRTYAAGEVLEVPGAPRAIHVPGHTAGECALHFADRDALITGDALVTYDPYTGRSGPRIVAGAATARSEDALHSLDALAATDAATVLPGHGDPWRGGVREAVARARVAGAS